MAAAALIIGRERLSAYESRLLDAGSDQHRGMLWARRFVAVALLSNELLSWVVGAREGHARVPLQLCDLSALLIVWALWSPRAVQRPGRAAAASTLLYLAC